MRNLKKLLNSWENGKKVRGVKTPPLETIQELMNIYNGVQTETINGTVIQILEKCGISAYQHGIGWRVGNEHHEIQHAAGRHKN